MNAARPAEDLPFSPATATATATTAHPVEHLRSSWSNVGWSSQADVLPSSTLSSPSRYEYRSYDESNNNDGGMSLSLMPLTSAQYAEDASETASVEAPPMSSSSSSPQGVVSLDWVDGCDDPNDANDLTVTGAVNDPKDPSSSSGINSGTPDPCANPTEATAPPPSSGGGGGGGNGDGGGTTPGDSKGGVIAVEFYCAGYGHSSSSAPALQSSSSSEEDQSRAQGAADTIEISYEYDLHHSSQSLDDAVEQARAGGAEITAGGGTPWEGDEVTERLDGTILSFLVYQLGLTYCPASSGRTLALKEQDGKQEGELQQHQQHNQEGEEEDAKYAALAREGADELWRKREQDRTIAGHLRRAGVGMATSTTTTTTTTTTKMATTTMTTTGKIREGEAATVQVRGGRRRRADSTDPPGPSGGLVGISMNPKDEIISDHECQPLPPDIVTTSSSTSSSYPMCTSMRGQMTASFVQGTSPADVRSEAMHILSLIREGMIDNTFSSQVDGVDLLVFRSSSATADGGRVPIEEGVDVVVVVGGGGGDESPSANTGASTISSSLPSSSPSVSSSSLSAASGNGGRPVSGGIIAGFAIGGACALLLLVSAGARLFVRHRRHGHGCGRCRGCDRGRFGKDRGATIKLKGGRSDDDLESDHGVEGGRGPSDADRRSVGAATRSDSGSSEEGRNGGRGGGGGERSSVSSSSDEDGEERMRFDAVADNVPPERAFASLSSSKSSSRSSLNCKLGKSRRNLVADSPRRGDGEGVGGGEGSGRNSTPLFPLLSKEQVEVSSIFVPKFAIEIQDDDESHEASLPQTFLDISNCDEF